MTVDLVIEAAFYCFSRHANSKYSNGESHEKNFPKRAEIEEKQEDFGLCQC